MVLRLRSETAVEELEKARLMAAEAGPEIAEKLEEDLVAASAKDAADIGMETPATTDGGNTSSGDGGDESEGESDPFESSEDNPIDNMPEEDEEEEPEESEEEEEEDSDDEPEEDADPEPSPEEKAKQESFRSMDLVPGEVPLQLRVESGSDFLSSLGSSAGFVLGALGSVGLKMTGFVLSGMFRVVLYTFARCFKILGELFDFVVTRIERFANRTSELRARLASLRTQLEEIQKSGLDPTPKSVSLDLNTAYLTSPLGVLPALKNHEVFMKTTNEKFQRMILSDLEALEMVSNAHYLRKTFDGLKFMEIQPERLGLEKRVGAEAPPMTSLYVYPEIIGGVELQMFLPDVLFDSWEVVEKAYGRSKVQLAVDTKIMALQKESVPTPSLSQLLDLLNILELLTDASDDHLRLCDKIARKRGGVLNTVKALFMKLAQSATRVYLNDSGAIPLYLKSSFVTKVYLVGAMDLHDHNARVIANGIAYAAAALKSYQR